nr:zinc finger, CCHC-type [Tanacetum cinerariifolium]
MAGNTVKEMTTNFGKLDKFEGHDFRRWQKKMHFLLTTLKVVYVLTTPRPELLEDATDFKHTLKHGKDDMSLVQLGSHLRIEESLKAQDSDNGKGKEDGGPSVNMTEEGGKNKHHKQNKGIAEMVKRTTQMLVVWERYLRTNPKTKVDAIAWWIDSSDITHVCKDHCCFKTYEPVKDGFCYVYLLHAKDEALDKFRIYKTEVELQQNNLVKTLRTDRGGEYYDPIFFQSVGIIHETTALYTPQQNGVAKRKNRALKKMVNSMLSYSGLSEGFWEEAMLTACYLLNRVPNKRNKTTPYELWGDHSDDVPNEIPKPRKGCKWVFKRKMKVDGTVDKFKARLVIQGFRQKERIDYFDTYTPVARITTIRLLLALAAIHNLVIYQMDVKTAFLNCDLEEEVYMKQPGGFVMPGTNQNQVDKTNKFLSSRFSMKDMREADVILGIKIKRKNKGIVITQSHYIEKLLKKFNREDFSSVSTPMDPVEKLKLNTEAYSDASWIDHVEDSSFTSGWVFLLGGGAIS